MTNRFRWEKQVAEQHIKFYEIVLQEDLFGDWVILSIWGRKNSKLGNSKVLAVGMYEDLIMKIQKIYKRRIQRGYSLIEPNGATISE